MLVVPGGHGHAPGFAAGKMPGGLRRIQPTDSRFPLRWAQDAIPSEGEAAFQAQPWART